MLPEFDPADCPHAQELLLWCDDPLLAPSRTNVWCWDGGPERTAAPSLLDYIERHSERIRDRYLTWIHDLGEVSVSGIRLRDRFIGPSKQSLWAHSIFVEQSRWKQPSLEIILRIFAVEEIIDEHNPLSVVFIGRDRDVAAIVGKLCARRGLHFVARYSAWKPKRNKLTVKSLIAKLPHGLQGFLALVYLAATRTGQRGYKTSAPTNPGRRIVICGPFFNLNSSASGEFFSAYWTSLPQTLREGGFDIVWLHYFYKHRQIPSIGAAKRKIAELNNGNGHENHCLVDHHFTLRGKVRVARAWLRIGIESVIVGWTLRRLDLRNTDEVYWPLIRRDWRRAFRGIGCVEALYFSECFDRALNSLPRQSECIYLMENQGWEKALTRAWRTHGHGRSTGVIHSSIRFWDLRYHCDRRRTETGMTSYPPGPDTVALNGPAMENAYFETHSKAESVVVCEALRYLHLRPSNASNSRPSRSDLTKILVLGDYLPSDTDALCKFLERFCRVCVQPVEIWCKSHPNTPIDPANYPILGIKACQNPVSELVPLVDIVLAGKSTTAAMDALICGAAVVVYDDGSGLNYSPTRGMQAISLVRYPEEFLQLVEGIGRNNGTTRLIYQDFLHVDRDLHRWKKYLGIAASTEGN